MIRQSVETSRPVAVSSTTRKSPGPVVLQLGAGALGIDPRRVHLTVFAVGTALALTAGALNAPLSSVYPNMGDGLLIISFVVVVIGGLGSVSGAFWSALLIGFIDTMGKAYAPKVSGLAIYVLMAIVLLWRPNGLFGQRA